MSWCYIIYLCLSVVYIMGKWHEVVKAVRATSHLNVKYHIDLSFRCDQILEERM